MPKSKKSKKSKKSSSVKKRRVSRSLVPLKNRKSLLAVNNCRGAQKKDCKNVDDDCIWNKRDGCKIFHGKNKSGKVCQECPSCGWKQGEPLNEEYGLPSFFDDFSGPGTPVPSPVPSPVTPRLYDDYTIGSLRFKKCKKSKKSGKCVKKSGPKRSKPCKYGLRKSASVKPKPCQKKRGAKRSKKSSK